MANVHRISDYANRPGGAGGGGAGAGGYGRYSAGGYQQQPEQTALIGQPAIPTLRELLCPQWNTRTFTFAICMIDLVVFIVEMIVGGVVYDGAAVKENPMLGPSTKTLLGMGASYYPELHKGNVWRLVTPIFLHGGVIHLLVNLYSQFRVGFFLETMWGTKLIMVVYFVSGVGGALLSANACHNCVSVGASGALFGLLGAEAAYLIVNWRAIPQPQYALMSLICIVIINLGFSFVPGIDGFAHIGGLIVGFFTAAAVLPPFNQQMPIDPRFKLGAAGALAIYFTLTLVFLFI